MSPRVSGWGHCPHHQGDVACVLVSLGSRQCNTGHVDGEGRTALMWACKTAAERTVAYLLSLPTVDPTLTMKNGSGAFDWAVFGGAIPIMELVAASSRVDIAARNLAGCSAIMWASSAGCVPICCTLVF